jgi:hypothetical protein
MSTKHVPFHLRVRAGKISGQVKTKLKGKQRKPKQAQG